MNYEKQELNRENRRYYALQTVKNGIQNILSGGKLLLFFALEAVLGSLLYASYILTPMHLRAFSATMQHIAFWMVQPIILYACGYIVGSRGMYRNFVRIGLVNYANEAPILTAKTTTPEGVTILKYSTKGVTLAKWQEEIDAIQSALDMTVVSVEQGKDHRSIILKAVPTSDILNQTIYFGEQYIDFHNPTKFYIGLDAGGQRVGYDLNNLPMGLIAGSTGSGKTSLAKGILLAAAMRGYSVYVLDFKGLDFYSLRERYGITVHTSMEEILNILGHLEIAITERREMFQAVGAKDLHDYIQKTCDTHFKRVLIYVDECAMLTDYGNSKESKKQSADVVDKLSAIARVGRAFGIHLLIATQRPDANAVPGSIKSNLDLRICGKADTTLSTIVLGDGRANEQIPKDSVGLFLMSDGVQDKLFKSFYLDDMEWAGLKNNIQKLTPEGRDG